MQTHWVDVYAKEFRKLSNQARFVTEIIENRLIVSKKSKPKLVAELREKKYEAFPKNKDAKKAGETDDVVENTDDPADEDGGARDYDYLLGLPIWSLTQERVDKLKTQMVDKKKQLDDLKALSEKDLWCSDLDEFLKVWDAREIEEHDIARKIRGMGRRVSKKLGAGKSSKVSARMKTDDDYAPKATKAKPNAKVGVVHVEPPKKTTQQKLSGIFGSGAAKVFQKQRPISRFDGADMSENETKTETISDTEFDHEAMVKPSRAPSEQPPAGGRSKRAAAAKPKNWLVDDDDDSDALDDDDLGDIGAMVKGIGSNADAGNGRVSLYNMSRPDNSGNRVTSSAEPAKTKSKPKALDLSSDDETNYVELAKSSPQKPTHKDDLDEFLSDDDSFAPPKALGKNVVASKQKKAPTIKKSISAAQHRPLTLSPAAKAYAAKAAKNKLKPVTKKNM